MPETGTASLPADELNDESRSLEPNLASHGQHTATEEVLDLPVEKYFLDPSGLYWPCAHLPASAQVPSIDQRISLGSPFSFPSPYKNFLQIQKLNFYSARIQNALYLGVPLVLAQKEEEPLSPWYWHTQFAALVSNPFDTIAYSQTACAPVPASLSFDPLMPRPLRRRPCFQLSECVSPDLAPTSLQRSHPHSMFLDMIPFPIFRDRVITLLCMIPPAFDEAELKRDIESEGLMVWGVAQGSVNRSTSLVRDRRNWECAKWFSKK